MLILRPTITQTEDEIYTQFNPRCEMSLHVLRMTQSDVVVKLGNPDKGGGDGARGYLVGKWVGKECKMAGRKTEGGEA